jgi:hypothetical protein
MGWKIRVQEFDSRRGLGSFLFSTAFRPALGPMQPPIQWIPGALSLVVKRPGREADHSLLLPGSRTSGAIPPPPSTSSWRGTQLSTRTTLSLHPRNTDSHCRVVIYFVLLLQQSWYLSKPYAVWLVTIPKLTLEISTFLIHQVASEHLYLSLCTAELTISFTIYGAGIAQW